MSSGHISLNCLDKQAYNSLGLLVIDAIEIDPGQCVTCYI